MKHELINFETKKRKRIDTFQYFNIPYLILMVALVFIPLFLIIWYSITYQQTERMYLFTLNYYRKFFNAANFSFVYALFKSIFVAFIATLGCFLIGYPLAYFISKRNIKYQGILILLVTVPMWINMLIRTLAVKSLIAEGGIILKFFQMLGYSKSTLLGTNIAIIISLIIDMLPFMVLPIYTLLSKMDHSLIEAARDLGAKEHQIFTRVVFPLTLPGIFSGISLVFLPSATSIVIPNILGNGINNNFIGYIIEHLFMKGNIENGAYSYGSAIAVITMLSVMFIIFVLRKVVNRYEQQD